MRFRVDWIEGARFAIFSLGANRMRTILTTLGIGIGVATLLAIVGIIQGLNASFARQIANLGASSLYVAKYPWVMKGDWWEMRNRKDIGKDELMAVREQCELCTAVAPMVRTRADVAFLGEQVSTVEIQGTTSQYPQVAGWELTNGRFLSEADDDNRRQVVVLGSDVSDALFPQSEPVGETVRIAGRPFKVIGTLARKGKILGNSQDLVGMIPYGTWRALYGRRRSATLGVAIERTEDMDAAEDDIIGIMRRARQTPPGKPDDFTVNRQQQLESTYRELTGALYGVAVGVGFITMLVGGIGIMNIMLVSVRERTREIGIRRALGARRSTIIVQFLMEASVVSAIGGTLGTAVGLGTAKIVSEITPLAAAVTPTAVFFGVGFSALVGLLFGIWPAARAANLDPVEALRYE